MTDILMRGRPGIVSHVSATTPETLQSVQCHWLVSYGSQLPDGIPYIMHIRHFDDYDAPTIPYPGWCVLMPGGFSYTPHTTVTPQILKRCVLKQLEGEYVLTHASPSHVETAFVSCLAGMIVSIHQWITYLLDCCQPLFHRCHKVKGQVTMYSSSA